MALHIMTAEGWKPVKDTQTIPVSDRVTTFAEAHRHVKQNRYSGWTPGILFMSEFNVNCHNMAVDLCAELGIVSNVGPMMNPTPAQRVGLPLTGL